MLTLKTSFSTYPPRTHPDFDYAALRQAALLLLTPKTANRLLPRIFSTQSPKDFLLLLSQLEHAARETLKTAPNSPSSISAPSLKHAIARKILRLSAPRTEPNYRLHLPLRIRCQAQYDAFFTNRLNTVRTPEGKTQMTLRLGTVDMAKVLHAIAAHPDPGTPLTLTVELDGFVPSAAETPVNVVWTDELPNRPEFTRHLLGSQRDNLEHRTRNILDALGRQTYGPSFHLLGGKHTSVHATTKDNKVTLTITLERKTRPAAIGELIEQETLLLEHLAEHYAISLPHFLDAVPLVSKALADDLKTAARQWNPEDPEIQTFLTQYNQVCLCLPVCPTPPEDISIEQLTALLEPAAATLSPQDYPTLATLFSRYAKDHKNEFPSLLPALTQTWHSALEEVSQSLKQRAATGVMNPAAATGGQWAALIFERVIEGMLADTAKTKEQTERLARLLGFKNGQTLRAKQRMILENFYYCTLQPPKPTLDQPHPQALTFLAPKITAQNREEFFNLSQDYQQDQFNAKGDPVRDNNRRILAAPDIAEFTAATPPQPHTLSVNPLCLYRMTRHPLPTRNNPSLQLKEPYSHPAHLPARKPLPLRKSILQLEIGDFLNPEALAHDTGAGSTGTNSELLSNVSRLLEERLSPRALDMLHPENPVDRKTLQWLNALAREKDANAPTPSDIKCNSLEELHQILSTLKKFAGAKAFTVAAPLRAQPRPGRSNPLPFKLLCGVKAEHLPQLNTLHNEPADFAEFQRRWENALPAELFPQMQLALQEKELATLLAQRSEQQRLELAASRAIAHCPSEPPRIEELMALEGAERTSPPPEAKMLYGIFPHPLPDPFAFRYQGEDMPLEAMCHIVSSLLEEDDPRKLQLIAGPEPRSIEPRVNAQILTWKTTLETAARRLDELSHAKPIRANVTTTITLDCPAQPDVASELEDIEKELSQATQSLTHRDEHFLKQLCDALCNIQGCRVHFGPMTIRTHPEFAIEHDPQNPQYEHNALLERARKLAFALNNPQQETDPWSTRQAQTIRQRRNRLTLERTIGQIIPILRCIPQTTVAAAPWATELHNFIEHCRQFQLLIHTRDLLCKRMADWTYEPGESTSAEFTPFPHAFQDQIRELAQKTLGTNPPKIAQHAVEQLLARTSRYASNLSPNSTPSAITNQLQSFVKEVFDAQLDACACHIMQARQPLSSAIMRTASTIGPDARPQADSPQGVRQFMPHIRKALETLAKTNTQRSLLHTLLSDETIRAKLPPSLQQGKNAALHVCAKDNVIATNKLWAYARLNTPRARAQVRAQLLVFDWMNRPANDTALAKEKLLFLQYLTAHGLQSAAIDALGSNSAHLDSSFEQFRTTLHRFGASGNDSLPTLLAAGALLHALPKASVLGKHFLENIPAKPRIEQHNYDVAFDPNAQGLRTASPFLLEEEKCDAPDDWPNNRRKTASEVRHAAHILLEHAL